MKIITANILKKLKPRFTWWKGIVFYLSDLAGLIILVILILPVLPWEGRKKGNYIPIVVMVQDIATLSGEFVSEKNFAALKARYQKIKDKGWRECLTGRNIVIPMIIDNYRFMQKAQSASVASNVPLIFAIDSVAFSVLGKTVIYQPNWDKGLVKVAEKCSAYKDAFASPDEVRILNPID